MPSWRWIQVLSIIAIPVMCLLSSTALAETSANGIAIPPFKDKYCDYVRKLESGKTDIDYADFRSSFLDSKQFNVKGDKEEEYEKLQKEVYACVDKSDYQGVVKATKGMLGIDYTSMLAHKFLQQTYNKLGDEAKSKRYKDIEFGLLKSITTSGDGKTGATAWKVTQVEEEYFILNMLGLKLKLQSVGNYDGNTCDKMAVSSASGDQTLYFNVSKLFAQYNKMFK